MKIYRDNQDMRMFESLQAGDVFNHKGKYFIKLKEIDNISPACNAVCLNDGELTFIGLIEFVDKIDGQFIINDKKE